MAGVQGQILEVTVVRCKKLKDTEWLSRQDPYVCLEYCSSKFRTQTCVDGGRTPMFQEKFTFSLVEGNTEMNVAVWNKNTLSNDGFIGYGRVHLYKVLSQGYDDTVWPIQTKTGRNAGGVQLIMYYPNARNNAQQLASPPYAASSLYNIQPPTAPTAYMPPPAPSYPCVYPPPPMYPLAPYPYGTYPFSPGACPPGSPYYPRPGIYPPY